jgi:predicted branched-subunit amino acid permease
VKRQFLFGIKDAVPIALGYLSVGFGFGIFAAGLGITPWEAWLISATNLTSAGQVAGVQVIAAAGSLLEMALTQLVITIRYSLMALSLSQKLDDSFNTPQRLLVAHGITDEIFTAAYSKPGKLTPHYMYGLITAAFISWTSGTLLGSLAGSSLPTQLTDALGIMLYAMFMAAVIPAARDDRGILTVCAIAAGISLLFYYVFTAVSGGFATVLSALIAAAIVAAVRPIADEEVA